MADKITIILLDKDGRTQHAKGEVDLVKYSEISTVERNQHHYAYARITTGQLVFIECARPVSITEF